MKPLHAKILLVDDEEDLREMTRLYLELQGYEVTEACDGAEAVKALDEGYSPDIVVIDGQMPVMNGEEFCTWLLDSPFSAIPVILYSGSLHSHNGHALLIQKGAHPAKLLAALRTLLNPVAPDE